MDTTIESLTDDWVSNQTDEWVSNQWQLDPMGPELTAVAGHDVVTDQWMMDVMEHVDYDVHPDAEPHPDVEPHPDAEPHPDGTTPKQRLQAITRIALSLGYACSLTFDAGGQWTCELCATLQEGGEVSMLTSGKAVCQECCLDFHRRNW